MTPETVLVRARNIEVRIEGAEDISVLRADERLERVPHALAVLDAFAQPRSLADVLDTVAKNQEEWIEISSAIYQLARAGVLVDPSLPDAAPRGFASPPIHVAMLNDRARTEAFVSALKALVRTDDVVLDIGTGTGVLATVAALAGASRVHAIESSAIGDAAQRVFATNGVADRVHLIRGRSTTMIRSTNRSSRSSTTRRDASSLPARRSYLRRSRSSPSPSTFRRACTNDIPSRRSASPHGARCTGSISPRSCPYVERHPNRSRRRRRTFSGGSASLPRLVWPPSI